MRTGTVETAFRLGLVCGALGLLLGCGEPSRDAGAGSSAATVRAPDGVPIAYEVHGTGSPALVFVHGWSCDRSYWEAQLEVFSRNHRVVAVDLAGHGESGLGRDPWTIAAFGGDVAAVVEELGLERVLLIGHSMGGDVILEAALRLPGRVQGLVWVDAYKRLGSPRTMERIQEILAPFRADFQARTDSLVRGMFPPGADASLVDRVATDMAAAPPDVAVEALESSFTYGRKVTVPLRELRLPVVAINPADPPTDVESLERHGVKVLRMSGVGHFPMLEEPERFNAILRQVVRRLSR